MVGGGYTLAEGVSGGAGLVCGPRAHSDEHRADDMAIESLGALKEIKRDNNNQMPKISLVWALRSASCDVEADLRE